MISHLDAGKIPLNIYIEISKAFDTLDQCFPTGVLRSHCAPRCIVKDSARDDITNK